MWISTFRGIARYDGNHISAFTKDKSQLRADYCSQLFFDKKHKLSFADGLGNLYTFKTGRPQLSDTSHSKKQFFGNPNMFILPPKFWSDSFSANFPTGQLLFQHFFIDSNTFITTYRQDVWLYNCYINKKILLKHAGVEVKIFTIGDRLFLYELEKGIYEITYSNTAAKWNFTPIPISFPLANANIYWKNNGPNTILTQGNYAYLLSIKNNNFERQIISDRLPANTIINNIIYNERLRTMAVSTNGNGIYIHKKKRLTSYLDTTGNSVARYASYYFNAEIRSGTTVLSGRMTFDQQTKKFIKNATIPSIISAYKVKDSIIVMNCEDRYLWSYNIKTQELKKRPNLKLGLDAEGYPGKATAFTLIENRLFYVKEGCIIELGKTADSVFYEDRDQQYLKAYATNDMVEYGNGKLAICGKDGVLSFDIHTKKMSFLIPKTRDVVYRGMLVYKGYLLLASYGDGIFVYKDGALSQLPFDERRLLAFAHNITIDKKGYAWIGTNPGVIKTKANNFIEYANNHQHFIEYDFYGKEEGMDLGEINGSFQGSVWQLADGGLSYAGIGGITIVSNPNDSIEEYKPILQIEKISLNDSSFFNSDETELQLPAYSRKVKVFLALPDWSSQEVRYIEYRDLLNSLEWDRLNIKQTDYIELSNLSPGEHEIQFRIADSRSIIQPSLRFYIPAPWYKNPWFKGFVAITAIFVIILFIKWRNGYLSKQNKNLAAKIQLQVKEIEQSKFELEEKIAAMHAYQDKLEKDYALKNRLISIIGHDILTPLRFMNRAGNSLLKNRHKIQQETFDSTFKTIVETGVSLQEMAGNMLTWIRHHQQTSSFFLTAFKPFDAVEEILTNLKPTANFKALSLINNVPPNLKLHQYADPLKTIILQLVTNAIKYSEKGSIKVNAQVVGGKISLSVKDDGDGVSPEIINQLINPIATELYTSIDENKGFGFGFLIIKDMLAIIHGKIAIQTAPGKGTEIFVQFPINIK